MYTYDFQDHNTVEKNHISYKVVVLVIGEDV
jgi:hypothetical protein